MANAQDLPVDEAEVRVFIGGAQRTLTVAGEEREVAHTSAEGFYIAVLTLPPSLLEADALAVEISKPGFRTTRQGFAWQKIARADNHYYVRVPDVVLPRVFNPAFFLATGIFLVVFGFISLNLLHETIAAFLGAAAMLGVSYFVGDSNPDFWIVSFHRAIQFIDFDVIFLLMMMMIFMAIMSRTGIFQWLAYQAFRLAQGNAFLVSITGLTSAVLNDTTVMLLMAPVSIQIALALKIHPAAIVVPEVLASNIGGISTLIGTPTNILIGSYAGLTFNDFLRNLTPGVLMAMAVLILYVIFYYRRQLFAKGGGLSEALLARLKESGRITQPQKLVKAGVVFVVMLFFFVIGERIHLVPAVTAIVGAVAMLLWVAPDIEEMLKVVDWTTLMFFIALFIVVGAIQEVGLISIIADAIARLVGDSMAAAILVLVWSAAFLSGIIDNIPFTAAMLPVVSFLSGAVPGAASSQVLFYGLSIGSAMGGNSSLIGASANLVTAGIAERAGYRITYLDFIKVGLPATILTVAVGTVWLFIRFVL